MKFSVEDIGRLSDGELLNLLEVVITVINFRFSLDFSDDCQINIKIKGGS